MRYWLVPAAHVTVPPHQARSAPRGRSRRGVQQVALKARIDIAV
jgi:hypothetical protein